MAGPLTRRGRVSINLLIQLSTGDRIGRYIVERCILQADWGSIHEALGAEDAGKVDAARVGILIRDAEPRDADPRDGEPRDAGPRDAGPRDGEPLNAGLAFREPDRHILQVIESGSTDDGGTYEVVEYHEYVSLADRLEMPEPILLPQAISIADQVAAAVEFAHRRGIVHGSLRPSCVLLDEAMNVYVTGFGARPSKSAEPCSLAPELIGDDSSVSDQRTDIWSLGLLTYELVTRQHPFRKDEPSEAETEEAIGDATPANPRKLNRSVPRRLAKALMICLSKEPSARFPVVADLRDALRAHRPARQTTYWFIAIMSVFALGPFIVRFFLAGPTPATPAGGDGEQTDEQSVPDAP